jgi:hypothetical protein
MGSLDRRENVKLQCRSAISKSVLTVCMLSNICAPPCQPYDPATLDR